LRFYFTGSALHPPRNFLKRSFSVRSTLNFKNFKKRVCFTHRPVGFADSQTKTMPYHVSASTTWYGIIFICPTTFGGDGYLLL